MTCNRYILAIDPGDKESGFVLVPWDTLKPIIQGKEDNEKLLETLQGVILALLTEEKVRIDVVIEMVESFGMPVGREIFDTCVWIGRFTQACLDSMISDIYIYVNYVTRKQEKLTICHSMKANDATIKQALVDRFTPGQKNYGKGTKKEPGFFWGFKADMWSAFAVAVTYHDLQIQMSKEE